MVRAAGLVVSVVLITSCGSDARITGDDRSLDQRIADARSVADPVVALGCEDDQVSMPVWDFEGDVDAPTEIAAAELILDDEMWVRLDLPGDDREAVFDAIFRIGRSSYLPVLVDGELRVLLGYDAQGPDRWSIGGGLWCDATP